jgi:glutamyl-Q tRNA(Asp) synthetase
MSATGYIGRFAPSPTGPLHFGSLIAALASFLDARAANGRWHLRIDDVDTTRTRQASIASIPFTLESLGLYWDGPIQRQNEHRDRYEAALQTLVQAQRAYPCACSRRDIAAVASRGPTGMIYPGTCRDGLAIDRKPRSWRFRVDTEIISFTDQHAGAQRIDLASQVGDFVIKRGDGLHAYHLAMVIDDAALGVNHIVRGGDLLAASAPQIALQKAFGFREPKYLHLPIANGPNGRKLSKTNGAPALELAKPAQVIAAALDFLGQSLPENAASQPHDWLINWAIAHWHPQQLPDVHSNDVE